MYKLKILGLVLLTIIFVLAGSIFLFTRGVDKTFLQASFYEGVVEEVELSPLLTGVLLNQIKGDISEGTQDLSRAQREEINKALKSSVSEALSEEWAEDTILKVVEDGLAYLKGEQEGLTAVIDLKSRKEIIRESMEEQVQESVSVPERYQGRRMTPKIRSQVESERSALLGRILSGIPDKVSLSEMLKEHPDSGKIQGMISSFQTSYGYFHFYSYGIIVVLVGLILLLGGILRGLKWIGTGMLISGFLTFGLLIGIEQALPIILSNVESELSMNKLQLFTDPFFTQMNTIVLYYTLIGLISLLLGMFVKKPPKKEVTSQ